MKKLLTLLLTVCLLAGTWASGNASAQEPEISSQEMTLYVADVEITIPICIYHIGDSDVPYVSLEDWAEIMTDIKGSDDSDEADDAAPATETDGEEESYALSCSNVDLNLDHQYGQEDQGLTTKNVYCLTSPVSFSCGNLVPCVFKNSNQVTIIGRTSGGGSCVVLPMSSACGSGFQISGFTRLAFTKNGSFYDIDQGAVPDFTISKYMSFYDRERLTEYIDGLL